MKNINQISLLQTFAPAEDIIRAYKQSSRKAAIKKIWGRNTGQSKKIIIINILLTFLIPFVGFLLSIKIWKLSLLCASLVALSLIFYTAELWSKEASRTDEGMRFQNLSEFVGLNYRLQRYIIFRENLSKLDQTLDEITRARLTFNRQAELINARVRPPSIWVMFSLSLLSGIMATSMDLSEPYKVPVYVLCFFCMTILLVIRPIFNMILVSQKEQGIELDVFLSWYESEMTMTASIQPKP